MLRSLETLSPLQHKNALLGTKFPLKLWTIINDSSTNAIRWGSKGRTIVLEYESFQKEFLTEQIGIFKTNNIASFVRQLNLYGFRKIYRNNKNGNEEVHEFQHPLFLRERRDLLPQIRRKTGARCSKAQIENMPPIPAEVKSTPTQVQKYHAAFQKALNRQKNAGPRPRQQRRAAPLPHQYNMPHQWNMMKKMLWGYPPMMATPYGPSPSPYQGHPNEWGTPPSEAELYAPEMGRGDYYGTHGYDKRYGPYNSSAAASAMEEEPPMASNEMVNNANNFYFLVMPEQMAGHPGMYPAGAYFEGPAPMAPAVPMAANVPMAQGASKGGQQDEAVDSDRMSAKASGNDNIFANLGYMT